SIYQPYAEAIAQEIAATAQRVGRQRVRSIFFGGGTPSMFPIELIGGILASVRAFFDVVANPEITLEVNPTTDDRRRMTDGDSIRSISSGLWSAVRGQQEYFTQLRSLGFNRLSLGVQSSHDDELHLLRRGHSFDDGVKIYSAIRAAGFENVNIDLIYALPEQSIDKWRLTLERVIDLKPEHISAYSLQVEDRTAMFNWVRDRKVAAPDDDVAANMYELTEEMLADVGFEHYEISNWASKWPGAGGKNQDFRSRHNLVYWLNESYLGFGCGSHSSFDNQRFSNALHPRDYISRISEGGSAIVETEQIDQALAMGETMMLGLRLTEEGVNRSRFKARFGLTIDQVYGSIIGRLLDQGLLESDEVCVRLAPRGRLLGNRVFGEFLPPSSK
ncbi:MAG TPA: coproporphyrinogen-III oxidase family protein, partial [Anaerolineae bacterium]|nr:coproporphyrinogen-III oxidase family protein [Anaerolineae bacterium]